MCSFLGQNFTPLNAGSTLPLRSSLPTQLELGLCQLWGATTSSTTTASSQWNKNKKLRQPDLPQGHGDHLPGEHRVPE